MPRWDYRCKECNDVREISEPASSKITHWCGRNGCHGELEKLPAAPAFKVNGFNASNRYSKEHK